MSRDPLEYVDGPSLAGLIEERGAMPLSLGAALMAEITDALQYAHEHGCPWDENTTRNARYSAACYEYAVKNGEQEDSRVRHARG